MSSSSSSGVANDNYEDACSMCLEPFNTDDPASITNCKHEYHLQCILEWSQRSKECPICWQLLVLEDPASQELLAAVENKRSLRSRHKIRHTHGGYEIDRKAFADDSDFDERIMRHFAATTSRACYVNKREKET
ncbi:E3 ubiquitin-protein ligase RHF1A-like [Cornus florida]|uniref:E3 ubiquitin-protein ligase RHF1A-like n=1 Tax=Cornus florida TaxID=4283 RepID=UPI0028A0F1F3|nr:E3 ubiquitin-protein ligase RHF1A-like [Cornus florida]